MASQAPEFVLAYDANCGPCARFKAVVGFLDPRRRIEFVSLDAAEESGLLAHLTPASRYASFHLIQHDTSPAAGGGFWSGSEAILPLMRSLTPLGRALSSSIQHIPVGATAVSFAYASLSRLHLACHPRAVAGGLAERVGPEAGASKIGALRR